MRNRVVSKIVEHRRIKSEIQGKEGEHEKFHVGQDYFKILMTIQGEIPNGKSELQIWTFVGVLYYRIA